MEIGAQLERVESTASQKFREAAFFYDQMFACAANVEKMPFFLSAFLASLRSVTFYLQKQYSGDVRFATWYPGKQSQMESDPILRLLNQKRNAVLKREPFDLFFRYGYTLPEKYGEYIETNELQLEVRTDKQGWLRIKLKATPESEWEDVEPWIVWRFKEEDEVDVINICYQGLEKVDAILKELTAIRIGMGLPADEEITFPDIAPSS